jgi:hypothetical protein
LKGFALLTLGKAENEDRQNHRVVGTQQSFERHEQRNGHEISELDVQNNFRY